MPVSLDLLLSLDLREERGGVRLDGVIKRLEPGTHHFCPLVSHGVGLALSVQR